MNTNQNIQYQSLLNRNVGTNIDVDEIDVDTITCINLTSSGTITANIVNVSGKLDATNDVDSIVSNCNTPAITGVTTGNYIIPLVSDTGGSGFRSLYNDLSLMYNATNDTITCGKATFNLGAWISDTPTLVLGDFGSNQGIIQLIGDATKSIFIEATGSGDLEIYQKVSSVLTLLFTITPTIVNVTTDMNLSLGKMYKINNVNIDTDDITSVGATNKYLNSLTATLPLLYDTGTNVVSISSTGNISVATIITTGRSEFLNGNNTQGTNYSAYFGTGNSKSAQLVLFDGLAVNQYAQLYCRSYVFGIQGNIGSISLEKTTNVTGSVNATSSLSSTTGTSNIVTPSSSSGSLLIGNSSVSNGVIKISSLSGAINNYGSFIQQSAGNLYIDNSGASSINIGTVGTSTTVNVYKLNITNTILYNSGSFHNYSKFSSTSFGHNGIVGLTVWSILSSPSVVFQTSITPRSSSSNIRINVNMTLSNWGTTAQNKHLSVTRTSSVGGFAVGVNATYDVIGATSVYGIHHILSGTTYDSVSFTFVDSTAVTAGTTYYYAVCARANSTTIPASPSAGSVLLGNSAYADIVVEELF